MFFQVLVVSEQIQGSCSLFERVARRKLLLFQKNIAKINCGAKLHLNRPKFMEHCPLDRQNQRGAGWLYSTMSHFNSNNPNTAHQHKHFIPAVKHSGEGVVIWAVLQPQDLRALQSLIWTPLYTTESKVRPSVQRLKLGRNWFMRWDKDQILSGWKRKEWRCYKMLQQRSQNSEHNPNEILLRDLKGNAHTSHPNPRWWPSRC